MDNTFIPKAMELIKAAVAADNANELEKALGLYKQGLGYFMTGLKYIKHEQSKASIREKIKEYMNRAEQIKEALDAQKEAEAAPKKKLVKTGAKGEYEDKDKDKDKDKAGKKGGSKKGDDDDDDDDEKDPETAKLQTALSHAIVTERPNVKWDDVAGLEQAKSVLKEAVILPIKFPQLFTGQRKPWRGILLYGPPGTGKSYLAKAVATEAGATCFFAVSSSDLVSKFQGESERLVRNLFDLARKKAPAIVFIDEVDSLCSARGEGENESARRIKTEFLVQMQGVGTEKENAGVLVLGATNTPWELDPAIRRRFEKRVYIPLPDVSARLALLVNHIGQTPHSLASADLQLLASRTDTFSGSDISVLVRDALYEPIRTCQIATHFKKVKDSTGAQNFLYEPCAPSDPLAEEMNLLDVPSEKLKPLDVSLRHFESALRTAKPSVSVQDLGRFEDWTRQFGQEG